MKASRLRDTLRVYYTRMHGHYGATGWWPGETPFEVAVGAILTQNTAWTNVEKTLLRLKRENLLGPKKILRCSRPTLEKALRPSGYFRVKAQRLRNFCTYLVSRHRGSMQRMARNPTEQLREELLGVNGIGPETADDILLYACDKPVFVVDAYTRRIFSRHGIVDPDIGYEALRAVFEKHMARDVGTFKEYHGLIVWTGKDFCRSRARCDGCPLAPLLQPGQPVLAKRK